ncbi:MAG: polysaccharide deacetylase family protein [Alphaproteobacteria bacterium]|nr:polysaccharide deacetylase family protein [Alphaproteobacteria bacterium]
MPIRTAAIAAALAGFVFVQPVLAEDCPGNPDALGVARTVEIDTTGGPGFGLEQYKLYDFLQAGEVVLTFDDGPWPDNTAKVLKALKDHCVKATFFAIGKHAVWHPHILKQVAAAGHTIGTHTFSHANLAKGKMKGEPGREEIEKGLSAVKFALGAAPAPFFRFPALQDPDDFVSYVGSRNLAIFSMDVDSFDFKTRDPSKVVKTVMAKITKKGKGIILMHDFQKATANGLPELLNELKKNGFKVVHLTPKHSAVSIETYDEAIKKEFAGPMADARPMSSVVKTITGQ